jgi:hypothetical protein
MGLDALDVPSQRRKPAHACAHHAPRPLILMLAALGSNLRPA